MAIGKSVLPGPTAVGSRPGLLFPDDNYSGRLFDGAHGALVNDFKLIRREIRLALNLVGYERGGLLKSGGEMTLMLLCIFQEAQHPIFCVIHFGDGDFFLPFSGWLRHNRLIGHWSGSFLLLYRIG